MVWQKEVVKKLWFHACYTTRSLSLIVGNFVPYVHTIYLIKSKVLVVEYYRALNDPGIKIKVFFKPTSSIVQELLNILDWMNTNFYLFIN